MHAHSITLTTRTPTDIAPFDPSGRTMVEQRRIILRLALTIDDQADRVRRWYREEKITEFGGWTPQELVVFGFGAVVVAYLEQIVRGYRD